MTFLLLVVMAGMLGLLAAGAMALYAWLDDYQTERDARRLWRTHLQAEEQLRQVSEAGRQAMHEAVRRHQWGGW